MKHIYIYMISRELREPISFPSFWRFLNQTRRPSAAQVYRQVPHGELLNRGEFREKFGAQLSLPRQQLGAVQMPFLRDANTGSWVASTTPWKINSSNLKMMVWKMIFLFNWVIFRFRVNLPGCNCMVGVLFSRKPMFYLQ